MRAMRVIWGLALVGSLLACKLGKGKPEVGKACDKEGERACSSPESSLVCQSGQWRAFPCSGKDGCNATSGVALCDISGNQAGDGCAKVDELKSACADPKSRTQCKDGKIERVACKGPKGCGPKGTEVYCDQAIADVGSKCFPEEAWACTVDQKTSLACKNGEWVTRAPCRGPKGCSIDSAANKVSCDITVAYVGDVCFVEGTGSCTHDARARLLCKNGKFAYEIACGGGGCKTTAKGVECP